MSSYFHKHKTLFLITSIVAFPFAFIGVILYGAIVGVIGGVVWSIQKARNFLLTIHLKDGVPEGLLLIIFKWIFVCYIFFFIGLLASGICLVIGPFRAFTKFRQYRKNILDGTVGKYKKAKKSKKPLVLVVDDEVDLAEYVSEKILSTGKYSTVMAHNGKEALSVLAQHERLLGIAENRIGCIVLDIKMPEMDGIQFLKELRKKEGALMFKDNGSFHQIPVIILSAYEDVDKISDATHPKLGKSAKYIMKPEKPEHYEELLVAIENVFAKKDQEMVTSAYLSGNYRIHELQR